MKLYSSLAFALACVASCGGGGSGTSDGGGGGGGDGGPGDGGSGAQLQELAAFPAVPQTSLDVLFLVDNSVSEQGQQSLGSDVAVWIGALGSGLDLHIGVTTSDMGTTSVSSPTTPAAGIGSPGAPGACFGSGQAGVFQVDGGAQVVGNYLDTGSANFTGTLPATLQQMITGIGTNGCGFEQSLRAVSAALASPANTGFRRPDVPLAIVLLSDEDDCSVQANSFFDPNGSGALGPLASFRCTAQGVTCDQALDAVGTKSNCHGAVGNSFIADVAPFIADVVAAEPDASRLSVSAIVAPATPFAVELRTPPGGASAQLALAHSCSYVDGMGLTEVGDPAVRTTEWATALGGQTYAVCQNDYTDTMIAIGNAQAHMLRGDPCLAEAAVAASCVVTIDGAAIGACPAAGGGACYTISTDATTCPDAAHQRVQVDFGTTTPAATSTVRVRCALQQ